MESPHLKQHLEKAAIKEVFPVTEAVRQAVGDVFPAQGFDLKTKAHGTAHAAYVQFVQQAVEEGVRRIIEDHEGRIKPYRFAIVVHGHGIGVATDIIILFKDRDIKIFMETIGAAEPRGTCTDDG